MTALVTTEEDNMLSLIERLATNPDVDPAKISAILDIKERMMDKKAEQEFNEAFVRLRSKLPIIKKGDIVAYENKKTGVMEEAFKFAKWEKVQALIDDIIAEEGFDLTFDSQVHPNGTAVVAILHHRGGHTRKTSTPPIPIDSGGGKNNVQGVGSSMSYGQRYATKFALNLRFEDDDDGVRGGMVFIDEAKVKQLQALIAETKADEKKYLEAIGVVALENIQGKDFAAALNALLAKKRKMQS